jgi:tricarballylate dehydrogenase
MLWLAQQGVRFLPLYEWQFKLPDGRVKFSGGSAVEAYGAGEGLSAAMFAAAERLGIHIVYGARVAALLHGEYRTRRAARFTANTLEELLAQLDGMNRTACLDTIREFNAALRDDIPYDAGRKDGRFTQGLAIPKSNWANRIAAPPFEAYAVTCGITFTFGGVRIDQHCRVLDQDGAVIPALYAAGELVGGLFYFNYPGGSGLMTAAVFGRTAGESAARALRA